VYQLVKDHWGDRPSDFLDGVDNLEKHIPEKRLREEITLT
jgi:hypothetical protein